MKRSILFILTFLLVYQANGQGLLTIGQVYDFEAEDEFHYENFSYFAGSSPNYNYFKRKVLNKTVISEYLIYEFGKIALDGDEILSSHLDTFRISGLAKPIVNFDSIPNFMYLVSYDYTNPEGLYNNRHMNTFEYTDSLFEPTTDTEIYVKGCGRVYDNSFGMWGSTRKELVYFKKGQETWGEPVFISSIHPDPGEIYRIFPNPFEDHLVIRRQTNQGLLLEIRMHNTNGELVYSEKVENPSEEFVINLNSNLEKGFFFCSIICDSQVNTLKLIKK